MEWEKNIKDDRQVKNLKTRETFSFQHMEPILGEKMSGSFE